jgi:3-hydroxyacyl-CoA dehydrogenase
MKNSKGVFMQKKIKKAAVLGSGVMGSSIAALIAGTGIETYLMDMVLPELDPQDIKKGLTRESPAFRNKLAQNGLVSILKSKPSAFFVPEDAKLVTVGNFDDNLSYLSDADWVIEVVVEKVDVKKALFKKAEQYIRPGTIVSTNTSGLSVNSISEDMPDQIKVNFLGTHFFNPPRYMKLIELIPTKVTGREVMDFMAGFCEKQLGKGVVFAKDTPNFIGNRIGIHSVVLAIREMIAQGFTIEEVDAITGVPMGRPKSATFRTLDMVGLDTVAHVARNLVDNLADDKEKQLFILPDFVNRMVEQGLLGDKKEKGFYQKVKVEGKSQINSINYGTMEYSPSQKAKLPVLEAIKQGSGDARAKLKALIDSKDKAGQFAWKILKGTLLYSASKIPEIADDIVNVDNAMKWGFNHDMGPFETWDAIGVMASAERMEKEGDTIPDNVVQMLRQGKDKFYQKKDAKNYFYDFNASDYKEVTANPDIILLSSLKDSKKVIKSNAGASLIDMGDGVVCLEFHSPNNAIGVDIGEMVNFGIDEVDKNYIGMVIGNHGTNFCVGANLMLILLQAQNENWDELEMLVRQFQGATQKIKFSPRPVVAAPFRMTLGGGCEICLASSKVRAYAETYMGLVEVGVGVIPAGGGCKEMLLRNIEGIPLQVPGLPPAGAQPDLIPFVSRAFETIAMAKVGTSAKEVQKLGYMRAQDKVTMNLDMLLHDAKETVISLAREGYEPPRKRDDIRVVGRNGMGILEAFLYYMKDGNYVSPYDEHVGKKLAHILCGGELPQNTLVTEDYLLELEREAFMSLCGEAKSQDRMRHMLQTGQALRN